MLSENLLRASVQDTTGWQALANSDPERPADGDYQNLSYVPWYCRMTFEQRLQFLDWKISKLEEERRVHVEARRAKAGWLADFESFPKLEAVRTLRHIELTDRKPLDTVRLLVQGNKIFRGEWSRHQIYLRHLDSNRWKRTRRRKMISVAGRCEYPDCTQHAENCHHLHYETLGFEENADLEALCRLHHQARHGLI
jgi:hypothetical protein